MVLKGSLYHFIIITLLLGAMGFYIGGVPEAQMEQGRWVTHTHEVLSQLAMLSGKISEMQVEQQAYLQTSGPDMQKRFLATADSVRQTVDLIKTLTKDNPVQQRLIGSLRRALEQRLVNMAADTAAADTDLAQQISVSRQEEIGLLRHREWEWRSAMHTSRIFFLSGVAMVYLLILLAYFLMQRQANTVEKLLKAETEMSSMQRGITASMTSIVEMQQEIIFQRLNLQSTMNMIAMRSRQITEADGAVIELLEGDEMVYRAASGMMKHHIGLRLKAEGSLSGLCVTSATPLNCADSETDERVNKELCRQVGLRSMIVVPLIHRKQTTGVLKIASVRAHAFSMEDMNTLQMMAGVLSVMLRDAAASEAVPGSTGTAGAVQPL